MSGDPATKVWRYLTLFSAFTGVAGDDETSRATPDGPEPVVFER